MMGLGAAGGVMMKADANASAITTLQNTVTQQGKDITSSSSAITSLQNGLVARRMATSTKKLTQRRFSTSEHGNAAR
jgi:hypothetical protein